MEESQMKIASIEKVVGITRHPNADKLEFATVLGYQCIVPKGLYAVDDLVILIQPDTVLPETEWSAIYRKFSKKRVKAIRLRGEWSFGIVEQLSLLPPHTEMLEGTEVAELLDIIKYEPPLPSSLDAKGGLPYNLSKTDEERYQNLSIEDFLGKTVDITLKVDGQSFTAYYKDGEFGVCGRTMEYKLEAHNNYTDHVTRYDLESKLRAFCTQHQVNIALRGESYGKGIQASKVNYHAQLDKGLFFFSVWLMDEFRYAQKGDKFYYLDVCAEMGLPTVPLLHRDSILTADLIKKYDEELEEIEGHLFEGVVIVGEDFSFKVINKNYDSLR
jgi:RNA ligase (TIGR02306 family)